MINQANAHPGADTVTSFPNGITLKGAGNNLIEGAIGFSDILYLGDNATGLHVSSSDNTVGGVLPAQRNVISNNLDAGVVRGQAGSTGGALVKAAVVSFLSNLVRR